MNTNRRGNFSGEGRCVEERRDAEAALFRHDLVRRCRKWRRLFFQSDANGAWSGLAVLLDFEKIDRLEHIAELWEAVGAMTERSLVRDMGSDWSERRPAIVIGGFLHRGAECVHELGVLL